MTTCNIKKESRYKKKKNKKLNKEMKKLLRSKKKEENIRKKNLFLSGGSPGLVHMGGDSCSKGREFESQHCILDGDFSTFICCMFV